jgi:hypothetical protein
MGGKETYFNFRINGSFEERNAAMMEDAEAYGIGCTTVGIVQLVISSSSIALLNFAAQKQVMRIIVILSTEQIHLQIHSSFIFFICSVPSIEVHETTFTGGGIRNI